MALITSSIRGSVFGDMRIVFGTVALSTTADEFSTGLDYVFHCSVQSEGTVGGNSDLQVVLNSNDGTAGTSAGDVYVDAGAGSINGSFMAIGK